jgi:hypothetical protein
VAQPLRGLLQDVKLQAACAAHGVARP